MDDPNIVIDPTLSDRGPSGGPPPDVDNNHNTDNDNDRSYDLDLTAALDDSPLIPGRVEGFNKGKGGKRARSDGDEGKVKKTRQSQSCDACRARKVKCDRPPPGSGNSDLPARDVCSHCEQLGLTCTFDYKPKKRGPPNLYLRRLQDGSPPSIDRSLPRVPSLLPDSSPIVHDRMHPPNFPRQDINAPYISPSSYYRSRISREQGGPGQGTLAEQQAIQATSLVKQGQGFQALNGRDVETEWEPALLMTMNAARPPLPDLNSHHSQHELLSPDRNLHTSMHPSHSPTYSSPSNNPNNPFDAVLPRKLLLHIIDLYFDYIYCLIPCLHKPTFMQDIQSHREDLRGEEEWTALVFSMVAATLVQLPRAFVSMPRKEVKALVDRCFCLGREYLNRDFMDVTVTRCILYYLTAIAAHMLGLTCVADAIFAGCWTGMLTLRLHEESSYANLNPVDRQLRRRIFWLQYGADRSFAALEGRTTLMSEDDCSDVALPLDVDDEYITEEGYLDQPEGRTPILSGFFYISKLFRISGQVLEKRRRDKRKPPSDLALQMRVNEINELFAQVMGLMEDCPPALRIDLDSDNKSIGSFTEDWDMHASADVRQLFLDPKASHAVVRDVYLVQQANIYVTQQQVRYMVLQYRDELHTLQREELVTPITRDNEDWRSRSSASRRPEWRSLFTNEEKDEVVSDLLIILQKIPIQVIAVNSIPLVNKVQFVASTLLDALPNAGGDASTIASQRTQRAQNYLCDFLQMLSDIEKLNSWDD